MTAPATVTADDGTVLAVPDDVLLAAYAKAMYGEGHGPLDNDCLVTIAGQAQHDRQRIPGWEAVRLCKEAGLPATRGVSPAMALRQHGAALLRLWVVQYGLEAYVADLARGRKRTPPWE